MKTFIYIKTDKTELLWKNKTIYEYIYVYIKLGKKYFNQRNFFFLTGSENVFLMYISKWVQYHMKYNAQIFILYLFLL